jgi:hypothetical protein
VFEIAHNPRAEHLCHKKQLTTGSGTGTSSALGVVVHYPHHHPRGEGIATHRNNAPLHK